MGIGAQFSIFRISVVATLSPGAISVPGLKVGDTVMLCLQDSTKTAWPQGGIFEAAITVADEIQQKATTGADNDPFDLILMRGV